MPSRSFPAGDGALVYQPANAGGALLARAGTHVTIYTDAAATTVATGLTYPDGSAVVDGRLLVDATSRLPRFVDPAGRLLLYSKPDGSSVVTALYADSEEFIALANEKFQPVTVLAGAGIDATGVADSTAAIQAKLNGGGKDFFLPKGTYKVTSTLLIPAGSGFTLRGAGRDVTTINYTGTGNAITMDGPGDGTGISNFHLSDFSLVGTGTAQDGIYLHQCYHGELQRLEVSGFGRHGIHSARGYYIAHRDLWCHDNAGAGLLMGATANANYVFGGHFRVNQIGIHVDGGVAPVEGNPHGCSIFGATFESNTAHDVYLQRALEVRVEGCYFEANDTSAFNYCINVSSDNAIDGLHVIAHNNFAGTKRSIQIDRSKGTLVTGNSINAGLWITGNAVRTSVIYNPRLEGTFSEGGSDTRVFDPQPDATDRNYVKIGTAKKYALNVGGAATVLDAFDNYLDVRVGNILVGRFRNDNYTLRLLYGLQLDDGKDITVGTVAGSRIGQAASLLGFYGNTPTARPALTYSRTGESTAEAQLRAALAALGLISDSTVA